MIRINNSTKPYSEQNVSLSGVSLTLILKYNIINSSWYLDIKDQSGSVEIISGIKVMRNSNLTGRYILEGFPDGNIYCLQNKSSDDLVTRNNLGADLTHSLYWLTSLEEQEFGIDGYIQL